MPRVQDELDFIGGDTLLTTTFAPLGDLGLVPGAVKFDGDKARMELLPLKALEAVAAVMTFGANKYADNGWKSLEGAEGRYTGALLRHLTAIQAGEVDDPESGLPHIAHVACNAIFLTYFEVNKDGKV